MPISVAPRRWLVLALAVAGCASGASVRSDALSASVRGELDGAALALLAETVRAVEGHDWDAYVGLLDASAYDEAVAFLVDGGADRQVAVSETLEGALSLGFVSTRVFPAGADRARSPHAGLDWIRTLTFDAVTDRRPAYDRLTVAGRVTLDDGTSLPVSVTVLRPSGPDPVLAVPQG